MPVFHHAGRRISYLDTAAAASDTPPRTLVLLHAFPLNAEMWDPQLEAAPSGWRFLAPHFRGFGQSDGDPSGFDLFMDDYAADVLALLDHLAVERAVVAGLSMGGYVAFGLLRLAAPRVAGLVLADTKAEADSLEGRNNRLDMVKMLDRDGVTAVVDGMVPRLLSEQTRRERPQLEEHVRAIALSNGAPGIGGALVRMMERPDSTALLSSIACPTLVIVGAGDQVTPPGQARAMRRGIPGAEYVEVPEAGHLSNLEQPDLFNAALLAFLGSL